MFNIKKHTHTHKKKKVKNMVAGGPPKLEIWRSHGGPERFRFVDSVKGARHALDMYIYLRHAVPVVLIPNPRAHIC